MTVKAISLFQSETDFDRHLPVSNRAVLDEAARVRHLEPVHAAQRLGRARDRVLDRVFHAGLRRARELDVLVYVIGHGRSLRDGSRSASERKGKEVQGGKPWFPSLAFPVPD